MPPHDDSPTDSIPQIVVPAAGPEQQSNDARPVGSLVGRAAAPLAVDAPAELSGMLLPTEHVEFASSPHPIIFVPPLLRLIAIAVVLAVLLNWHLRVLVHGHHLWVPLLAGPVRNVALIVAGLLALREIVSLVGRAIRYFGFRVVATNRRIFVVEGLFGRHVRPVGNTALAGATMSQGPLGRILGYGDIVVPASSALGPMRAMRDPVRLYRECEAVANGVDGDRWTQAVRQTVIP